MEQKLDKLPKEAAIALLRHLQVVGTEAEMEAAWKDSGGHALTLQLLGRFIADAHGGDIRHFKEVKFEEADLERQGRSAFKVMIAYEHWLRSAGPERQRELALLRLTGLFDQPISRDCLQALRAEPAIPGLTDTLVKLKDPQWNIALKRLFEVDLLTVTPESVDAHPLIREYFAKQLRDAQPAEFQAAHSRLFDHLCQATEYRPDTLDGLQPLYEAVFHGCLAGRQQETLDKVYIDRILRGTGADGFYTLDNLGAIGADLAAAAAYFDEPWICISPNLSAAARAWLLNQAAMSLRAVGRLTEGLQPLRAALEMHVQRWDWKNAAICASNLSELEVKLGLLTDAIADGYRSITHADQFHPVGDMPIRHLLTGDPASIHIVSDDRFDRPRIHTVAADALHQSGRRDEAATLFAEAETMQKERLTRLDVLSFLAGFRYCDWLLAPSERAAYEVFLRSTTVPPATAPHGAGYDDAVCAEVERRATTTLAGVTARKMLREIALDHLTLARAGLIRAILCHPLPQPTFHVPHVAAALDRVREAGATDELPRCLLTAALYHFVRGDVDAARTALDQAQEIAERGPMPLYLADIHLNRARLFRNRAELAKAQELIAKHGYWRRKKELEDAEDAAARW
jgi:tetratricopeptide (TPR) repeat protein